MVDVKQLENDVIQGQSTEPQGTYTDQAIANMRKVRDEHAAKIPDPFKRREWIQKTDSQIMQTEARLLEKSKQFWHDEELTKVAQKADEAAKLALIARPEDVAELSQSVRSLYDNAFEQGHFKSYSDYQRATDSTLNGIQIGRWKNSTDIAQKRDMLEGFKSGKIQNKISADTLITMEESLRDEEAKQWSLTEADNILRKHVGEQGQGPLNSIGYDRAINEVYRTVKDPEQQASLITRINQRREVDSRADNEVQNKVYNDWALKIDEEPGFGYDDIPYEEKAKMTPGMRDSLKQKSAAGRRPDVTDHDVVTGFLNMANKGYGDANLRNMQQYLRENSHRLTASDEKQYWEIARGQKDIWDSGLTDTQAVSGLIKSDTLPKAYKNQVVKEVGEWRTKFTQQYGRPPTDAERTKYLDAKTIDIVVQKDKWGGLYDDVEKAYTLEGLDREVYDDTINTVIRSGTDATPENVQQIYELKKKINTLEGDDRQTYDDVMDLLIRNGAPVTAGTVEEMVKALRQDRSLEP